MSVNIIENSHTTSIEDLEESEEYDPFKQRNTEHLASNLETAFHLLTILFSAGITAVPFTFSLTGWLAGIIILLSMTSLYSYILNELLRLRHNVCKNRRKLILNFPEVLRLGLRDGPQWLARFSKPVWYLAFSSCLINVVGNIISLLTNIAQHMYEFAYTKHTLRIWIFTCFVPLFILLIVIDTKKMTLISVLQNIAFLCGVGMAVDYLINNLPSLNRRDLYKKFRFYPLFVGINLKSLNTISTVLVIEMRMKTPEAFIGSCGVLNNAMRIWVTYMMAVGFFGYWKFGDTVSSSFLSNFPSIRLTFVAKSLVCVSYYLAFPSQVEVIMEMVWFQCYKKRYKNIENEKVFETLVRVSIGIICGVIGFSVPNAGIFLSVVGCMVMTALCCIFPVILNICNKPKKPFTCLELVKSILLISIGLSLFACIFYLLISNTLIEYAKSLIGEFEMLRNIKHYYPNYIDF